MKSKLTKAQEKISHVNPRCFGSEFCEPHNEIDEVYYSSKNVKKLLSRQRKEIIKELVKVLSKNTKEREVYYKGWGLVERYYDLSAKIDQAINLINNYEK